MSENQVQTTANADQSKYWNTEPGRKWIVYEKRLNTIFQSINDRLLEHAVPNTGERVLDIGCGTGAMTRDIASRIGRNGSVVGVDISSLLLERAEEHQANAELDHIQYLLADAQTHDFDPEYFDLMVSLFGVMFFADPIVAFKNLFGALRSGGRLSFVGWAPISGNPWFEIPRDAAVARLGKPSPPSPRAPGPLAFADIDYVLGILEEAGFSNCSGEVETVNLFYPGAVEEPAHLASDIGPSAVIMRECNGTAEDLAAIQRETTRGFQQFAIEGGVSVPAILNFFDAVKR
jgi:SAM-dependent methyltransferase